MTKVSLEELKARSMDLGHNPESIKLVRAAKSPTAAYDLFVARGNDPEFAKKCRYLAMIKRDYGKVVFEQVASELVINAKNNHFKFCAKPFAQTATRLLYLRDWAQERDKSHLNLPAEDEFYVDIVEECVTQCKQFDEFAKAKFSELGGATYLGEAERFLQCAKGGHSIDRYSLEKTARVIVEFLKTSAYVYGVSYALVPSCYNAVTHYVWNLRRQKEAAQDASD